MVKFCEIDKNCLAKFYPSITQKSLWNWKELSREFFTIDHSKIAVTLKKIVSRNFSHQPLKDHYETEKLSWNFNYRPLTIRRSLWNWKKLSREILSIDHSKIAVKLKRIVSRNFNHRPLKDHCDTEKKLSREIDNKIKEKKKKEHRFHLTQNVTRQKLRALGETVLHRFRLLQTYVQRCKVRSTIGKNDPRHRITRETLTDERQRTQTRGRGKPHRNWSWLGDGGTCAGRVQRKKETTGKSGQGGKWK